MSLRSSNNIRLEGGGMSSMTDLVFLLLIFFIILSTLAKNETEVNLPQGGSDGGQSNAISIVVYPDNTIKINEKNYPLTDAELIILDQIETKGFDKTVELYADVTADYGTVYKIIDIAKQNQLKVALMTTK